MQIFASRRVVRGRELTFRAKSQVFQGCRLVANALIVRGSQLLLPARRTHCPKAPGGHGLSSPFTDEGGRNGCGGRWVVCSERPQGPRWTAVSHLDGILVICLTSKVSGSLNAAACSGFQHG